MLHPELRHIIQQLKRSFEGPAWYGPAVQEVLEEFEDDDVHVRINGSYSPIELVLHMVQWRSYAIRMLEGDYAFASEAEMTYPRVESSGEYGWTDARIELGNSQAKLIKLLEKFPAEDLDKDVPKRDFSWAVLLHGISDHDIYHLGQLRFLQKWP
jgi:hypothetical protein